MELPKWELDEQVAACRACNLPFSLLRRRHHCRGCGRIFCSHCVDFEATLPTTQDPQADRVCARCVLRFTPGDAAPLGDATFASAFPVVVVSWSPNRGDKLMRCALVLQGFRAWLIQGSTVHLSLHLFAVTSVHVADTRVTVTSEPGTLLLDCLEADAMLAAWRALFEAMCVDTVSQYRAWCDYFASLPSAPLMQEIVDLRAAGERTLDLASLPGAQGSFAYGFLLM